MKCEKWTKEEDAILLREVKAMPQNLSQCFLAVSEITGRTPKAVGLRWYQQLSKRPENLCFFTASSAHIARNRKNSMGKPMKSGIWQRLRNILSSLK